MKFFRKWSHTSDWPLNGVTWAAPGFKLGAFSASFDWPEASKTINLASNLPPRSGCCSTGFTAEVLRNVHDLLQLWEMRDDLNIYWHRERCETHLQLVPPQVLHRNPSLDQLTNGGEDESLFFKGVSVLWHLDISLSEVRTCLMLSVSFTCHWTCRKGQRLLRLSEAFNSISWLMTAAQKSHISHITRIYATRLYSMCPSLPLMHADFFCRQSGHMKEVICTQRWLQANKKGNCSCIHPWGWRWAAPALLVGLSLWVITDWIRNKLFLFPFFKIF